MSELIHIELSKITPYKKNSRVHNETQVAQIVASIKEFGFTNPVLLDKNYEIIAGHGRYEAALRMGLDTVPAIILSHLTDVQKKAYVIADNKLALGATWDYGILTSELSELMDVDFNLDAMGIQDDFLDSIFPKDYEPMLEPTASHKAVTDADMDKKQGELESKFENATESMSKTLVELVCPNCGEDFQVNKEVFKG